MLQSNITKVLILNRIYYLLSIKQKVEYLKSYFSYTKSYAEELRKHININFIILKMWMLRLKFVTAVFIYSVFKLAVLPLSLFKPIVKYRDGVQSCMKRFASL